MLPPFIIEQIRRREEHAHRQQYEQPRVEIPLPSNMPRPAAPERMDDDDEHGVVIIDL